MNSTRSSGRTSPAGKRAARPRPAAEVARQALQIMNSLPEADLELIAAATGVELEQARSNLDLAKPESLLKALKNQNPGIDLNHLEKENPRHLATDLLGILG